ncbi:hypothetical protein MC885_020862 [Smutsia gigantea]|nr:hypothetical protein MC885_020862 [Smutsia gigantea]
MLSAEGGSEASDGGVDEVGAHLGTRLAATRAGVLPSLPMVSNPHSLGQQAVMYDDPDPYDRSPRNTLVSRALAPDPVSEVKGVAVLGQVMCSHLIVPWPDPPSSFPALHTPG